MMLNKYADDMKLVLLSVQETGSCSDYKKLNNMNTYQERPQILIVQIFPLKFVSMFLCEISLIITTVYGEPSQFFFVYFTLI